MATPILETSDTIRSLETKSAAAAVAADTAPQSPLRDSYLDLLRAIAILMVVAYHVIWTAPVAYPRAASALEDGRFGVDIFFVLSGWLIGGLYWREFRRFGNTELRSFLPRRWLRTLPPYFAALFLAWLAVWVSRGQPFLPGYLFFIQNYYLVMPFFMTSWSLCVEEHFYLVLPLGLKLFSRIRVSPHWFFAILLVTSPVSRWITSRHGFSNDWNYMVTATHLRFDGLVLGFWASYLPYMAERRWLWLRQYSRWLFWCAWLLLFSIPFYSVALTYRLGLFVLAVAIAMMLVHLTGRPPVWIARTSVVKWIALTSYSVYLTHTLMIHAAVEAMRRAPFLPTLTYFPLSVALIASGGALFYLAFERTSLLLRARISPRRTK